MSKRVFGLVHLEARKRAAQCIAEAPDGYVCEVREPNRNNEQNSLLWVWLTAFAEQLTWPVNGEMVKLVPEEWKDLLTAAYRQESQRVAMGINGGMVMLGMRTSKMSKRQFAEFLSFVESVAADRCVALETETT